MLATWAQQNKFFVLQVYKHVCAHKIDDAKPICSELLCRH